MFEPSDGSPANLSDEQFRRLKEELEDSYQGAINAGRPFLLEGGLKWQQLSPTPHDMEFMQSKNVSAREITLRPESKGSQTTIIKIGRTSEWTPWQEVFSYYRPGTRVRLSAVVIRGVIPVFAKVRYWGDRGDLVTEELNPGIPLTLELGRQQGRTPARKTVEVSCMTTWLPTPGSPWNWPDVHINASEIG